MIGARRFLGAVVVWSERVVVRDGVRLVCRDRGGPGEPVVLLHGLAGHAGEWEVVASRLIARYRVVAVDQRGHGASERHPQDVSRAAYVADVVAATVPREREIPPSPTDWLRSGVTRQRVTCTAGG